MEPSLFLGKGFLTAFVVFGEEAPSLQVDEIGRAVVASCGQEVRKLRSWANFERNFTSSFIP